MQHNMVRAAAAALLLAAAAAIGGSGAIAAGAAGDISGTWWVTKYDPKLQIVGGGPLPLNAMGKEAYSKNRAGLRDGSIVDAARKFCVPDGIPRVLTNPYPFEIIQAPPGASLEYTTRVAQEAEKVMFSEPEIEGVFSVLGFSFSGAAPNNGMMFARLKDWEHRREKEQSLDAIAGFLPAVSAILSVVSLHAWHADCSAQLFPGVHHEGLQPVHRWQVRRAGKPALVRLHRSIRRQGLGQDSAR